jgi:peptidoglycan/LPS O-acetylase OafA/YrhL
VKFNIPRLMAGYTQILGVGGLALLLAALVVDPRWINHPVSTALLAATIFALRAVPVRLSKYSYLTQSAVPTLVGAVCIGPTATGSGVARRTAASDSAKPAERAAVAPVTPRRATRYTKP